MPVPVPAPAGVKSPAPAAVPPSGYRALKIIFLVVIFLSILVQGISLGPWKTRFWGFHLWSQVYWPVAVAAVLLWLTSVGVLLRSGNAQSGSPRARLFTGRETLLWTLAVSVLAGVLFWLLRSGHTLLGDGYPISVTLPRGELSPRLPLTKVIQVWWVGTTGSLFSRNGATEEMVVRQSLALLHVISGILFVPVALGLGRVLARDEDGSIRGAGPWLAGGVILFQGFVQLYFGYIEHYTCYALVVAVFLWVSLLHTGGRLPLWIPLCTFVLAVGLHLSAVVLLPAVVFLIAVGLRRAETRVRTLRDFGVGAAAVLVLNWGLGRIAEGYGLAVGFRNLFHTAAKDHGGGSGFSYMFSPEHFRDFLNEQFLVGPMAAVILLPILGLWFVRRSPRKPHIVFLLLAALSALLAGWMAAEPTLGYPRDWDVFAPLAITYSVAVLGLIMAMVPALPQRNALLLAGVLFSAAHLGCWVALNHSESRSLTRLGILTGQKGRNQVAVGNWFLRKRDSASAGRWFRMALDENPLNNDAMNLMGVVLAQEGDLASAVTFLDHAVRLRPDKPEYRKDLVRALMETHRYEEALPHLEILREKHPEVPGYWIDTNLALAGLGRTDEAAEVLDRAVAFFEPRLDRLSSKDHDLLVNVGLLMAARGRTEQALGLFRRALAVRPDSEPALLKSVELLSLAGRPREARTMAERFIESHPDHPQAARLREWMSQPAD